MADTNSEKNISKIIYVLNSSDYLDLMSWSFYSTVIQVSIIIQSMQSVMISVTSLTLMFILVTSSPRKQPLRNGMLKAITVTNLFTGLIAVPLGIDILIKDSREHLCAIAWAFFVFVYDVESFVQLWSMVLLLLHHLAHLLGWKMPPAFRNIGSRSHYLLRAAGRLYVLLPWIVALLVVVPLIYSVEKRSEYSCYYYMHKDHKLTLHIMTGFLPGTLIVLLAAAAVAMRLTCGMPRTTFTASLPSQPSQAAEIVRTSRLRLTPDDDDNLDPDPTYVHVLVGLTTLLLLLPNHALSQHRPGDYKLYLILVHSFYVINDLAPTVQALMWLLLLPDLRARLQQVCAALKGRLLCKRESSPLSASGAAVPTVRFATLTRDD